MSYGHFISITRITLPLQLSIPHNLWATESTAQSTSYEFALSIINVLNRALDENLSITM